MKGLGRQLEGSGRAFESVERTLGAIEFQTSILTLNAAVEAADSAERSVGSTALPGRIQGPVEHASESANEAAPEATPQQRRYGAFPPIAEPDGSTPQRPENCGTSDTDDSKVQARVWRDSLKRLRQSLATERRADFPIEMDGRRQAEKLSLELSSPTEIASAAAPPSPVRTDSSQSP